MEISNFENNIWLWYLNSLKQDDFNKFDFSGTFLQLWKKNGTNEKKNSVDEDIIETDINLDDLNKLFVSHWFPAMSENYYNILDEKFFSELDNKKVDITFRNNMISMRIRYFNLFISFTQNWNILCKSCTKTWNSLKEVKNFKRGNKEFVSVISRNSLSEFVEIIWWKNKIIYKKDWDYWQKTIEKNGKKVIYRCPGFDIISPENYMNYIDETLIWVKDWIPCEGKIDFSNINIEGYENYVVEWFSAPVKTKHWRFIVYPKLSKKKQESVEKQNRSEWFNRKIETIRVHKNINNELFAQLYTVSNELWFKLETVPSSTGPWIEDYSIRRHDGKIYIPPEDFTWSYVSESRKKISNSRQWQVRTNKDATNYSNVLGENDIIRGKSYLEWWNVLNTIVNGKPWAIVWDESIYYSLKAMKLDDTEENREIVKKQIAEDLWIEYEQLTFIPQIDFHIDMVYRPLQDGTIAVPDYSLWIEMFSKYVSNDYLYKQQYLDGLIEMQNNTNWVLDEAENLLGKWWYKIKKTPSFTIPNGWYKKLWMDAYVTPIINFMNWVGWRTKDWMVYYITNTSTFPELDKAMKKYFQKIGINKIYFLDTQEYLNKFWAFDCLTQEI